MNTTFYDYSMSVGQDGTEFYRLCANTIAMRGPRYCLIKTDPRGTGWIRETQWGSVGGRRYEWFPNLDDALISGVKWARRREKVS